eukprot:CCRYP_019110-RA/>CCRYP_019110-RA protein AED:0.32 eAED:0.32 QI:0/0/0/1/0/0/2/0/274
MDGEFEKVKTTLINIIEVNITSRNEHVPEIERNIRHIKERVRSIRSELPYSIMPGMMIKRMVLHAVLFMNAYVDKQGISDEYSLRDFILRWQLNWKLHCKYQFGAYEERKKDTGEVKGRTCINRAPQREYIRKEDATSPTVATDSVFLTGALDAYQRRDVAFIDLPGAFLHTLTNEMIIMVLRGELCELMCMVDPKLYRKYVCKDRRGKPILYELYKSLYGLMRSALLFYKKLKKELENYGMIMNPYDMCVANKETKSGHQLTMLWHVDNLKIS